MARQGWESETWNVEVWSVDVKAGGHWGILLVLHLPVLRREMGEWQDPRMRSLHPASRRVLSGG